jgi:DNA polymerase III subunit chi
LSTEIIFLTLSVANKLRIVCDVVYNEFSHGNKVVINVSDENEGKTLDNMLWSWKQSSFIPHNFTASLTDNNQDPVLITTDVSENISYDTLVLVQPAELEICYNYKRVIDFAEKYNPTKLETDRKRYKLYRDKKYKIETLNPGEFLHN